LVALEIDKYRFTNGEVMFAMLSISIAQNNITLAISANKFKELKPEFINSVMLLSGIEEIISQIEYYETNLKSNLTVKNVFFINSVNENFDLSFLKEGFIRNFKKDEKNLFYNHTRWKKIHNRAFMDINARIITRKDYLTFIIDASDNSVTIDTLNKYPKLSIIDNDKEIINKDKEIPYNLHGNSFEYDDNLAINISSSRSVSITNYYENANVIFSVEHGDITASHLQTIGRFRNSPMNVFILTHNKDTHKILADIKKLDKTLYDTFSNIKHINFKGSKELNEQLNNTKQWSVSGKEITKSSLDKKKSIELFKQNNNTSLITSKKEMFKLYNDYCLSNNLTTVSFDTLLKSINIADKNSIFKLFKKEVNKHTYPIYKDWCKDKSIKPVSRATFYKLNKADSTS
jgi:hypothetical protein